MRIIEIFGQASKNIDGYRASIASKEAEIERLNSELEECQTSEQKFKSLSELQQRKEMLEIYQSIFYSLFK